METNVVFGVGVQYLGVISMYYSMEYIADLLIFIFPMALNQLYAHTAYIQKQPMKYQRQSPP